MSDRVVARHETQIMGKNFTFVLHAAEGTDRRAVSTAIQAAVAELRAVEYTFSPLRVESLVSMLRRDEFRPDAYPPPLRDIIDRCTNLRTATDGWFDAWAVPGGFDPGGMVTGWGLDRAAALLRNAGIHDYAVSGGGDHLVRGHDPDGNLWTVDVPGGPLKLTDSAVATCRPRGVTVVNPHTGDLITASGCAVVQGPDLCVADAYATALYAAGPTGLDWFPTEHGYTAYLHGDDRPGTEPAPEVALVEAVAVATPEATPEPAVVTLVSAPKNPRGLRNAGPNQATPRQRRSPTNA